MSDLDGALWDDHIVTLWEHHGVLCRLALEGLLPCVVAVLLQRLGRKTLVQGHQRRLQCGDKT